MTPEKKFAVLMRLAEQKSLRMTPQRFQLLTVVSRTAHHPTADELYREVRKVLPSVSHATVYRNVQQLVEAGLLSPLERAGQAVKYDCNLEQHHHFICRVCGRIFDVYLNNVRYSIDKEKTELSAARVEGCEVQLRGVCADCQ